MRSQRLPRVRRRSRDALLRDPGMRAQQQVEEEDEYDGGQPQFFNRNRPRARPRILLVRVPLLPLGQN